MVIKIRLIPVVILMAILPICSSYAQESSSELIIESLIESLEQNLQNSADISRITEDLRELSEYPLNINAANASELGRLHLLNDIQIRNLLVYIDRHGPAYSIFELARVEGFSRELLNKLKPFIWFGTEEHYYDRFPEALKYGDHQFLLRSSGILQKSRGYRRDGNGSRKYEGNRFRHYFNYRFRAANKFAAGFTGEKDPGESFFHGSNKNGFDFNSAYLSIKGSGNVEHITLGDYNICAGQGLVIWQGHSLSKSSDVLSLSKTGQGIKSYRSADENRFLRGMAASVKFGEVSITAFGSHKKIDANIIKKESSPAHFTSLQTSGYHRTSHEIDDERSVKSTDYGSLLKIYFGNLKLGAAFALQKFNIPLIRNSKIFNKFRFNGRSNWAAGIDYLFTKGKIILFGETAISRSGGKAILQGARLNLHELFQFSLLFRHMGKKYHALRARAFTEGLSVNNESGLFIGLRLLPVKRIKLTAYADFFHFAWHKYNTAGPSFGREFLFQADWKIFPGMEIYFRHKNELKERKIKENNKIRNRSLFSSTSRIHLQYRIIRNLTFRTRAEHSMNSFKETEKGWLVYQDIIYKSRNSPIGISSRLAWINTDSYNTRIYAYENDLIYAFSIPAYYGKGFHTYLLLKYKLNKKTDFGIKFSNTRFSDRNKIGSGYNEIKGKNKTGIKFQIRLKI